MVASRRHWTPRYIKDKLSLVIYERRNPKYPWLTRSAIEIISTYLKEKDVGLEWGSGRSTIWLASRVQHLTSVDDSPSWFKKVSADLKEKQCKNVEYHLALEKDAYVGVAGKFDEESLDFVLIDGAYRDFCALEAISKVRAGGCIIIDNVNRYLPSSSVSPESRSLKLGCSSMEWQLFLEAIANWRTIWTSNGVTDTAIFMKA